MLDLKSDKSIILGLGDLKLSDTEYTLNNEKRLMEFEDTFSEEQLNQLRLRRK